MSGNKNFTILIRNVETGVLEKTLEGDDENASRVQYSPKGDKIGAGFYNG